MGPLVAQRLLNNEAKVDDPQQALRLPELYATLHAAMWSELQTGNDIPLARRNLQRDYVCAARQRADQAVGVDARRRACAAARGREERCVPSSRRRTAPRLSDRGAGRTSPKCSRRSTRR